MGSGLPRFPNDLVFGRESPNEGGPKEQPVRPHERERSHVTRFDAGESISATHAAIRETWQDGQDVQAELGVACDPVGTEICHPAAFAGTNALVLGPAWMREDDGGRAPRERDFVFVHV